MTDSVVTRLVIAYNSAAVVLWQAANSAPMPTLVVDNASRDDSARVAEELGYRVLRLPANIGFGRGIMAGLAEVETPLALILNPDAAIDRAGAEALVAAADRYPDADIFAPRLVDPAGKTFFRYDSSLERRARYRRPPEGDACVPIISGAAMLVRVTPFIAFGGFDPKIFLCFEDDDLAFRCRAARRPMVYVPEARVVHLGGQSSSEDDTPHAIMDISFGWSRAHVMKKHRIGNRYAMLAQMAARWLFYLLVGRWQRFRRQSGRMKGGLRAVLGYDAPFMPPRG